MAHGDGSVYQRSDGKWVAKYVVRPGGKAKYLYGKSESEVKRKLKQFKQSPEVVAVQSPTQLTLEEYLWDWLRVFKKPSLKQSSYDRIESVIRGTIAPKIGEIPLGALSSKDCQEFINGELEDGKSYWVIKKAYDALNNCLDHAERNGDIVRNPMHIVNAPTKANFEQKDTRALTEEETAVFLATGSVPSRPASIVGIDGENVHIAPDILTGKVADRCGGAFPGCAPVFERAG